MASNTGLTQGLGRRLLTWSILNVIIGGLFFFISPFSFLKGIGLQGILWGLIDAVIALFTLFKQNTQLIEKISKVLRINIVLDIGYQLVGITLLVFFWQDAFLAGNGLGVIIQGLFLFFLDLYYYLRFNQLSHNGKS
ncbi:MAG: DUF6992 family protein [Candidatus Thorarchaeota archaeon SMTZ1-45]|nr:MAG: hypothetical protein AM325_03015 [Candidatus Thorarchaeota archaeon SMTZ1-45]